MIVTHSCVRKKPYFIHLSCTHTHTHFILTWKISWSWHTIYINLIYFFFNFFSSSLVSLQLHCSKKKTISNFDFCRRLCGKIDGERKKVHSPRGIHINSTSSNYIYMENPCTKTAKRRIQCESCWTCTCECCEHFIKTYGQWWASHTSVLVKQERVVSWNQSEK